jgi:hypothetical protein
VIGADGGDVLHADIMTIPTYVHEAEDIMVMDVVYVFSLFSLLLTGMILSSSLSLSFSF